MINAIVIDSNNLPCSCPDCCKVETLRVLTEQMMKADKNSELFEHLEGLYFDLQEQVLRDTVQSMQTKAFQILSILRR